MRSKVPGTFMSSALDVKVPDTFDDRLAREIVWTVQPSIAAR
jgi:hypothetical protein